MGKTYKDQRAWEKKQQELDAPRCASCGIDVTGLTVYHYPSTKSSVDTVCEQCHLTLEALGYGHGV